MRATTSTAPTDARWTKMVRIIYMNSDDPRNHYSGPGWFVHIDSAVASQNRMIGPFVTFNEAEHAYINFKHNIMDQEIK